MSQSDDLHRSVTSHGHTTVTSLRQTRTMGSMIFSCIANTPVAGHCTPVRQYAYTILQTLHQPSTLRFLRHGAPVTFSNIQIQIALDSNFNFNLHIIKSSYAHTNCGSTQTINSNDLHAYPFFLAWIL